jgi:DNA-binding beta-propeller fold protein YncE
MGLKPLGHIDLPEHLGKGGFDHAAVDRGRSLLYVAHTANDAVDVIDLRLGRYARSIGGLKGVAGALVDEPSGLLFTSNRGENTVGIVPVDAGGGLARITVGIRPNGLAYDSERGILLCANVGDAGVPGSASVTLVDVRALSVRATVSMPGRTRWAIYDPGQRQFFVNIAEPFEIVALDPGRPDRIARRIPVPSRGPHGLDLDRSRHRLYCVCDEGTLIAVDSRTRETLGTLVLSGAPDVVFLDSALSHLYVAIGEPGVIDVIDVAVWKRLETIRTERGAHTLALDETTHHVYAFLPETHRAQVLADDGRPIV